MRALMKFDISKNLIRAEGGKALAAGLKGNQAIIELNIADNELGWINEKLVLDPITGATHIEPLADDMSGIVALADAIPGMEALSSLNLATNRFRAEGTKLLAEVLRGNKIMTELNISNNSATHGEQTWGDGRIIGNKHGEMSGIIALADAIPDMEALSIANVMGNRIGKEMLSKFQEIIRSKPKLISLCGIADDATEVDLSGLHMDDDDAIVLASELPDKGAMTSLNLASNNLCPSVECAKIIAACLPKCT
jgi:hypothetical protein